MSTFAGLNTARTALWASQRGLDVTGQNIANVNTAGYSRQRADLQSIGGSIVPAVHSVSNGIGQGVSADTITRIRDAFLERRAQSEHALTASLTVQDTTLTQIEDAFREPGKTGISHQLTTMWSGWSDVMNNPTELGARSQVLETTRTLVDGLRTASATLDQQWTQNHVSLGTLVADVNATATSIADLNLAIERATSAGMPSNELADKRDALALKLAGQVGATATVGDDGGMTVTVGGSTLVHGSSALALRLAGSSAPADAHAVAPTDPPRLITGPGGTTVRPGGTAAGQLASMTDIIPRYQRQLDGIAQQLADRLNPVHQSGYDLNGNPGKPLFDDGSGSVVGITAANINLAISSTDELAAASLSPADAGAVSGDNRNADTMYQLRLAADGVDATYRKLIVTLGVEAATTTNNVATQSVISAQVDASRESVAGVNLDEEMTNMLQFQHGYQAAGRLVTAIDEMLDVLINRTGLVGR